MIDPARNGRAALAPVAVAALAVACCAAVPLLATAASLLAVGMRVGIGAAVTLVFVACVALCVHNRSAAGRAASRS